MMVAELCAAVASVLHDLSGEVEQVGHELCDDGALAERHLASLQQIDRFAQHLAQLAQVIGAADPVSAVSEISLGDLHDRLAAATPRAAA
jgi:hypothetical protein